mgnify:CR=1 FL=1
MLNAKISGIASYLPDYVLTNDELSRMVDTNDEWITTRVGIKERRILKKDCLLYTSPSSRDYAASRMPSSA